MSDNIIFPLLGLAGGVVLFLMGMMKRGRAQAYRQIPCGRVAAISGTDRQFITGKAHSPAPLSAPVTRSACVFYLEKIERKQQGGRNSYWVTEANNACGGFFVNDGSGSALVVPGAGSLDLSRPEFTESDGLPLPGGDAGAVRRTELFISEGEDVTVLGTPRSLVEFMTYLRQNTELSLPSDLLSELTRLELDPAASGLRCFFGSGVERLADQPYETYVEGTASSGASFIQMGILLAAASALFLVYLLKSALPVSSI